MGLHTVRMFVIMERNNKKGAAMTTATTAPKTFRNQREHDPDSEAAQLIRDTYWAMFGHYSYPGFDIEDFDVAVTKLQAATGWSKTLVKHAILGHAALQELPNLRALQRDTRVMDIAHLPAVYTTLEELGPDADDEFYAVIDDILVDTFTPKRHNQLLPQRKTVTDRIRAAIKRLDPTRAYNKRKRTKREQDTDDTLRFDTYSIDGTQRCRIELLTNATTSKRIHVHVTAIAREHGISTVEAAEQLLSGELAGAQARPVINVYSPKGRAEGDPVYIPGSGWTDPEATAAFDDWLAESEPVERNLDAAAEQVLRGYAPSEAMRQAVGARNRTCVYPGCNRPAEQCQLDHRIPYEEGGETAVGNLFPLCQHHHNMKTDRRAFYVPDPTTGDIIWLFADGTFEVESPDSLLHSQFTPTTPRWRSSLANVRKNRARLAEFYAKGHTILDQFDTDLDLTRATTTIQHLEEEYGMRFPFTPQMPYQEPLPEEPYEPPIPDPEYTYPAEELHHIDLTQYLLNYDFALKHGCVYFPYGFIEIPGETTA